MSRISSDSASRRHTSSQSERWLALPALLLLCVAPALPARESAEDSWFRYENAYFLAYSNASKRQARKILEDLEYFRAAVLRAPDLDMPGHAEKTLVVVPATREEFARLAQNQNAIGFAQPLSDRTAIVFPATGRDDKSKYVLHHEYAHALAHGNLSDYPQWYMEGFAEVAASFVVHKRHKSFYVGMHEGRWHEANEPRIDWDELIADDFDAHALDDVRATAGAYAQYWLLAHFLTMSGSREYLDKLERYLFMIENGETSVSAFSQAFGMTANELWKNELRDYLWRVPEYRHGFVESSLDPAFRRTRAEADEIGPMLKFFADKAAMAQGMDPLADPLSLVDGRWDHLKLTGQCTELMTFRLDNGADELVVDDFYVAGDGRRLPAVFSVQHQYGNEMLLRNITRLDEAGIALRPDYQLSVRGENVLCLDEVPSDLLCQRVLQRCETQD